MARKVGRPKSDNPKDIGLKIRITTEMNNKLLEYSKENNITRGEVIRLAVTEFFKK